MSKSEETPVEKNKITAEVVLATFRFEPICQDKEEDESALDWIQFPAATSPAFGTRDDIKAALEAQDEKTRQLSPRARAVLALAEADRVAAERAKRRWQELEDEGFEDCFGSDESWDEACAGRSTRATIKTNMRADSST